MRILVLSPNHPEIVAGGAERAAYSLFKALKDDARIDSVTFVAQAPREYIGHSAPYASFRGKSDELVVSLPVHDGFTLESGDVNALAERIEDLVHYLRPDVVHLHHVLNWGVEVIELFVRAGVPIVMTLHEFIFICHQNGQMITPSGRLCYGAYPVECSLCFPERSPGKFFIRAAILRRLLQDVDVLISPNRFLANRFDEWRQAEGEIKILENVIDINETEISRISVNNKIAINEIDRKIVIAHFGQINPFKGLDILFEAYGILKAGVKDKLDFRVYGENNHWLGGSFDRRLTALFDAAGVNPGDKLVSGIGQVV